MISNIVGPVRERFNRRWFSWRCAGIFTAPVLELKPSALHIVSMVSARDLTRYLIALNSLYRRLGEGAVTVLNDGSLTASQIDLLRGRVRGIGISDIKSTATGNCPTGGCWERLCAILDLSQRSYVIQMDSDILVTKEIQEIADAVRSNRSFTLGTPNGQRFSTFPESSDLVRGWASNHVQAVAERALENVPDAARRRYVRGCAGFTGFGRGACTREALEEFSGCMSSMLGSRWKEWGTEQVSSNYMIANAPDAFVLPYPKYATYEPALNPDQSALLHFMGTYRYEGGHYTRLSREFIQTGLYQDTNLRMPSANEVSGL